MEKKILEKLKVWSNSFGKIGISVYDGAISDKNTICIFQNNLVDFSNLDLLNLASEITSQIKQNCLNSTDKRFRAIFELVPSGEKYPYPKMETIIVWVDCDGSTMTAMKLVRE